jgi:hypothetical protein
MERGDFEMGGISDLLADLSAGMFDDDPEFMEAVGWDEYDVLHQEGVEHDVRQQQHEHAPSSPEDDTLEAR